MQKYPTPEALAEAEREEIVDVIRHLGLQNQRAGTYQNYAKIWSDEKTRPRKGRRYAVPGYPTKNSGRDVKREEVIGDDDSREAWEIGHMTQGPYALDSWRIFCRDVCRELATGWNGEGASSSTSSLPSSSEDGERNEEGEEEGGRVFQPEWMRVIPEDKELRALLRWMWLKEGFEWDPFTGEKEVASQELLKAAGEGRIAWDEKGGMRVLDKVIADAEVMVSDAGARECKS